MERNISYRVVKLVPFGLENLGLTQETCPKYSKHEDKDVFPKLLKLANWHELIYILAEPTCCLHISFLYLALY